MRKKSRTDSENTLKSEVSGEGEIVGGASIDANPKRMEWGTAPRLVRATTRPGKINIKASILGEGPFTIQSGELEIECITSSDKFNFTELGLEATAKAEGRKQ